MHIVIVEKSYTDFFFRNLQKKIEICNNEFTKRDGESVQEVELHHGEGGGEHHHECCCCTCYLQDSAIVAFIYPLLDTWLLILDHPVVKKY